MLVCQDKTTDIIIVYQERLNPLTCFHCNHYFPFNGILIPHYLRYQLQIVVVEDEGIATKKIDKKNPTHPFHLRRWVGQLIIISKVQHVISMTLNMRFNNPICIFLPKSYNFLFLYPINSFLQLNFCSRNIYFYRCFFTINTSLHLLPNIFIQSQCKRIFNISLHLLSNHSNLYISIHCTSNTIYRFSQGLLICYFNFIFFQVCI